MFSSWFFDEIGAHFTIFGRNRYFYKFFRRIFWLFRHVKRKIAMIFTLLRKFKLFYWNLSVFCAQISLKDSLFLQNVHFLWSFVKCVFFRTCLTKFTFILWFFLMKLYWVFLLFYGNFAILLSKCVVILPSFNKNRSYFAILCWYLWLICFFWWNLD